VVTGLDIEPGQVIAAEVQLNGGVRVVRAGGLPIAPDVVREGEVADVEGLTEALQTVFTEHKLPRDVRVGVANQRIMVRTLELPPIADPKELEAAVRFKAQDEIPMPPESVVLDFHSLGVVETVGGPRQRVLLVAARRDMIERLLAALEGAGLRPHGIDLAGFALIRALHQAGSDPDATVLYLHMSGLTNLVVARGVSCVFTRVLGTGLEGISASVAERCVLPIDEARALIFKVGLTGGQPALVVATPPAASAVAEAGELAIPSTHEVPATVEDEEPRAPSQAEESWASAYPDSPAESASLGSASLESATPPSDASPTVGLSGADLERDATVRAAVADGVRLVIAEVRNSLDYHLGHLGSANERGVERVVLSGPATGVPGLVDALAAELKLSVTIGEVAVGDSQGLAGVPASRLAIAAGLAVNEVAP
jgi:type IV pilus assembly protein PilM